MIAHWVFPPLWLTLYPSHTQCFLSVCVCVCACTLHLCLWVGAYVHRCVCVCAHVGLFSFVGTLFTVHPRYTHIFLYDSYWTQCPCISMMNFFFYILPQSWRPRVNSTPLLLPCEEVEQVISADCFWQSTFLNVYRPQEPKLKHETITSLPRMLSSFKSKDQIPTSKSIGKCRCVTTCFSFSFWPKRLTRLNMELFRSTVKCSITEPFHILSLYVLCSMGSDCNENKLGKQRSPQVFWQCL